MLQAFRDLGYEVEEVSGYSAERKRAARRIRDDIDRGRTVDFVYAESVTMPNALSDPNHLPAHPAVDISFFAAMRRRQIPVGVFYRDIHWRFDQYRTAVPVGRQIVARAFYRFDLAAYRRTVDVLFVPSLEMASFIPGGHHRIVALPPGGASGLPSVDRGPTSAPLDLLHVGGVRPPLYDLGEVLAAVEAEPCVRLVLCCRPDEAAVMGRPPRNCTIVNAEGDALHRLYEQADLSLLYYGPHPYRQFAIPVKLFESVAHGVPVVANSDTAAGRLVESHDLGICVSGASDLRDTFRALVREPSGIDELRAMVRSVREHHTWTARAHRAATVLTGLQG